MELSFVRCAKSEDYDGVETIMKEVQRLHIGWRPDLYKAAEPVCSRERFEKLISEARLLVAESDGRVVGLLSFRYRHTESDKQIARDVLFVDDLAVKEEYRGQGIGSRLLQFVKDKVRAERLDGLELQVLAKNTAARKLYEGLGFTEKSVNMELSRAPRSGAQRGAELF